MQPVTPVFYWGFWSVSCWHGQWTKWHLLDDVGRAVCGRWANPESGHEIVYAYPKHPAKYERCATCERVRALRGLAVGVPYCAKLGTHSTQLMLFDREPRPGESLQAKETALGAKWIGARCDEIREAGGRAVVFLTRR